jgi:tyrosyl-tRNA synthetase
MGLFDDLSWRGLVQQATHEELPELLGRDIFTLYCGFDPTADSLHIGHLVPIMALAHFQRAGHRPIILVGGATGMIGDPSFKSAERKLLSPEILAHNVAGMDRQLRQFLSFDGENAAIVVNNADWLGQFSLIDFLRDIGKHFSVNVMLSREAVRQRLEDREHGISYTEFSYSLLQAYDFLHLYDTHGCRLQIGASDQWGNIVAGMDLTRRLREGASTFGLTLPLVTKPDGSKFGKTEAGTVWLDPARTSPYRFYQFWVNQPDAEAPKFLRYFTFLTPCEIMELEQQLAAEPEKRAAQRRLAAEVTRMVHGDQALHSAIAASEAMFGGALRGLDDATLEDIFSEVPSCRRPRAELREGRPLLDVLVECAIVKSKGEGRRLIQSGGVYLNNERLAGEDIRLSEQALCSGRIAVVRTGKKNYHLLKFEE